MVSLSPRMASILSVITILVFYTLVLLEVQAALSQVGLTVFGVVLWVLIFTAAWGYSTQEVINTMGVSSSFDLKIGVQLSLFIFSSLTGVGFVSILLISSEIVQGNRTSNISLLLLIILVTYLLIYPLIEFYILSSPGEDSTLPAETFVETFVEKLVEKVKLRTIATVLAYVFLYIIPIMFLSFLLQVNFATGVVLWVLLLPLINLGLLAGTGIGEDLLRLKLVRKGHTKEDLKALGLPKISFRNEKGGFSIIPNIQFGGLFLVAFAIQAIFTTTYFAVSNIIETLTNSNAGINFGDLTAILVFALVLLNKGRGAMKEMIGVWREGGFKVNVFPMYLAVFILHAVALSSVLEIFVSLDESTRQGSVLGAIGLDKHLTTLAFFLAMQNIILVVSAIYVYRKPPASSERRLVLEVPKVYNNTEGWEYIYSKLKSKRAVLGLMEVAAQQSKDDPSSIPLLKTLIKEVVEDEDNRMHVTAAKVLLMSIKHIKLYDPDLLDISISLLHTQSTGAQIYAVRALRIYSSMVTDSEELVRIVDEIHSHFTEGEISVRWEAEIALRSLMNEREEVKAYILSLIIRDINQEGGETKDISLKFLYKATQKDQVLGVMAISTLITYITGGMAEEMDGVISAVRQVLRARPNLGVELNDVLLSELESAAELHRANAIKILGTLVESKYGNLQGITTLIIRGLDDEEVVMDAALDSLQLASYIPELAEQIIEGLTINYDRFGSDKYTKVLAIIGQTVTTKPDTSDIAFALVNQFEHQDDINVLAEWIDTMGVIGKYCSEAVRDNIVLRLENYVNHQNSRIRFRTLYALENIVINQPEYSSVIYQKVISLKDDADPSVQVALIEILGHIAEHSTRLSKGIFNDVIHLTKDPDWQVRAVAYQTIIRAAVRNSELQEKLMEILPEAFSDSDAEVRAEALNYVEILLRSGSSRVTSNIYPLAKRLVKSKNSDEVANSVKIMNAVADRIHTNIPDILFLVKDLYESGDAIVRYSLIELLETAIGHLNRMKQLPTNSEKAQNVTLNKILSAANSKDIRIRRFAYEAMAIVGELSPIENIADRARKSIVKAKRHEKDPALLSFLEECRIRSLPRSLLEV